MEIIFPALVIVASGTSCISMISPGLVAAWVGGLWVRVGGAGAAVVAAKWAQLTGLSIRDGGLNGYASQHAKGQKKMEGVNLRG